MSEQETQVDDVPVQSELESLKERANLMQIKFHPNIGVKKLKGLVNARLEGQDAPEDVEEPVVPEEAAPVPSTPGVPRKETKAEFKVRRTMERKFRADKAKSLVRIRLTCMNPAKTDWHGEIYTVQSRLVGTIRKFVPFNADQGWHVPHMMYEFLKQKQCQVFHTVKQNGVKVRQGKMVPEFAIEVLPLLTQKELDVIAHRQAARNTLDE